MLETLRKDLVSYKEELDLLNKKLVSVEEQRQVIIKAGLRVEAVLAYIRRKITDEEILAARDVQKPQQEEKASDKQQPL